MYQLVQGQIQSSKDSFLPYTLIQQERKAKSLCIVLPGLRYTVHSPALYYLTNLSLDLGMDVLHINYQYGQHSFLSLTKGRQKAEIIQDVGLALDELLNKFQYSNFYLIGKSLGTIPMAYELTHREKLKDAKAVWLTPLLNIEHVYKGLLTITQQSIIFIGDNDHHYNQEHLNSLAEKANIEIVAYEQVDHQLNHQQGALASIAILESITLKVKEFILQSNHGEERL